MGAGVCNKCRKTIDTCTCLFIYQKQREVRKAQREEAIEKYKFIHEVLMQTHGKMPTVLEVCLTLATVEGKNLKEIVEILKELKDQ
jgi:hypothetical protein